MISADLGDSKPFSADPAGLVAQTRYRRIRGFVSEIGRCQMISADRVGLRRPSPPRRKTQARIGHADKRTAQQSELTFHDFAGEVESKIAASFVVA